MRPGPSERPLDAALILNATLEKSPSESNTGAPARYVGGRVGEHGVEVEHLRAASLVHAGRALQAAPIPAPPGS